MPQKNQLPNNNFNKDLVDLAAPFLENMYEYFGTNSFDIQSIEKVLSAANCPAHLLDEVIDNCVLAGLITISEDGQTVTINKSARS